jgi:hypothetical protein
MIMMLSMSMPMLVIVFIALVLVLLVALALAVFMLTSVTLGLLGLLRSLGFIIILITLAVSVPLLITLILTLLSGHPLEHPSFNKLLQSNSDKNDLIVHPFAGHYLIGSRDLGDDRIGLFRRDLLGWSRGRTDQSGCRDGYMIGRVVKEMISIIKVWMGKDGRRTWRRVRLTDRPD